MLRDVRLVFRRRERNHARAERAFIMVSSVVNVFDAMMKSVVSGLSARTVSTGATPSTLDTKCMRGPSRANGVNASVAIAGPRSDPPMPMLTTSVIAPGESRPRAAAQPSLKSRM